MIAPENHVEADLIIHQVELEKVTLSWLKGLIFRIDIHDSIFLEIEDIDEIQEFKRKWTQGSIYGTLFVAPRFGNLTREAREYMASPAINKNAVAKAVVAPNVGIRLLVDFFILVDKPPVEHKAFTNPNDAMEWLWKQIRTSQAN